MESSSFKEVTFVFSTFRFEGIEIDLIWTIRIPATVDDDSHRKRKVVRISLLTAQAIRRIKQKAVKSAMDKLLVKQI